MDYSIIENYVERVYGYAVRCTYSREEADELSQEILLTAVREFPKLRDKDRLEPWLWGIAENVAKSFRRKLGRQRKLYAYHMPEHLIYEEWEEDGEEELYAFLRSKIAMLSEIYRTIVILYYYDGLSTKQISVQLNIPEGTVTWRLSEARKKLKKECVQMEESALRPVKMEFSIYGNMDGSKAFHAFPTEYIKDSLSQNILYYCYEEACSVEELSKFCGVPAYYIEERVEHLLEKEAVIEPIKRKYRTNFIVWSDKYGIYCEEHAERAMMPLMDKLLGALEGIAAEAGRIPFYKAGKSESDLFYLYALMAFSYIERQYCKLPYPQIKEKWDGSRWCYLGSMETGKHHRVRLEKQCVTDSSLGYSYRIYGSINGISCRSSLEIEKIAVCKEMIEKGESEHVEMVAEAVQDGYITKQPDGSFLVKIPLFTKEQKEEFDKIADKYLSPILPEYSKRIDRFISGYKKLFPRHLKEDAERNCYSMFEDFCSVIIEYAQRTGRLKMPSQGCYCDVFWKD